MDRVHDHRDVRIPYVHRDGELCAPHDSVGVRPSRGRGADAADERLHAHHALHPRRARPTRQKAVASQIPLPERGGCRRILPLLPTYLRGLPSDLRRYGRDHRAQNGGRSDAHACLGGGGARTCRGHQAAVCLRGRGVCAMRFHGVAVRHGLLRGRHTDPRANVPPPHMAHGGHDRHVPRNTMHRSHQNTRQRPHGDHRVGYWCHTVHEGRSPSGRGGQGWCRR
mmetsp:Transcript_102834/g.294843  ORF Transcript_102834/g.294843 Transcript_102834/m.294843 type:complete len:224 (-) Transcript_102834:736-1407(-)